MHTHDTGREIMIGRVPPIVIDAQDLHVDTATVHALEALRPAHDLVSWIAPLQRLPGQQFTAFGHHHVPMQIDHPDGFAVHENPLAGLGIGCKRARAAKRRRDTDCTRRHSARDKVAPSGLQFLGHL